MCFKTKVPPVPAVQPAPTKASVDTGEARRRLASQKGVLANVVTSPLGDVEGYGKNAQKLATLGA